MTDVCQKHDAKLLTYGTLVRPDSFYSLPLLPLPPPPPPDPTRDGPILDIAFSIDQRWAADRSRLLAFLVLAGVF